MNNHRLSQLLTFYEEDPTDPFNLYALALYYPAAQFFAERNDEDAARAVFEQGIVLAASTGQEKTHRELQAAYRQWQDEWE